MGRARLACLVLLCGGCTPLNNPFGPKDPPPANVRDRDATRQVPANPFDNGAPPPPVARASYTAAGLDVAARVDTLGRKIVAANPQSGVRPLFHTIGAPVGAPAGAPGPAQGGAAAAVFHQRTDAIFITEGLVRQCKTDAELAAVLCHELGKMVAERETLAGLQARVPEQPGPTDVPIGNDTAGSFGPADQTHLAELAKYGRRAPGPAPRLPPPDADQLARGYLEKAGYCKTDLDGVAPLLNAASTNVALERQINRVDNWQPAR